jgi:FkbM family methyltransferase
MDVTEKYKKIWTRDDSGELILRDLAKESEDFTIQKYYNGEKDSYNYMWCEMFHHYIHDDIGCDYERYGCFIQPDDVVLDLGANIGLFAYRAETRGASKVYCFEPLSYTYECLSRNKGDKTTTYNLGVGLDSGFKKFKIHSSLSNVGGGAYDPGSALLNRELDIVHEEMVYIISINDIFTIDKFDFMKIDIEGSEVGVLNSITDENLSSLRCLSGEFHFNGNEEYNDFQRGFSNRLDRLGFDHFTLYHGDGALRTLTAWKR